MFKLFNKIKEDKVLASHKADVQMRYNTEHTKFIRDMLPSSIEEKPDMIVVNDHTLVRSIVVGVPRGTKPGYPAKIRPEFLDDLLALSSKNCTISYSFGVVPISTQESINMAEQAVYSTNVSLGKTSERDKNLKDISTELDRKDFINIGEMLHYGRGKQFSTSLIITIWAQDMDSMRATESRIVLVLKKHVIEYDVPKFKMMEAYRASLPLPTSSKDFQVELFSDYAAQLAALQNPNSRTSEYGYLVGEDRITGKQIIVDPSLLHATYTGSTGSGKSVAMLTHLRRCYSLLHKKCIYVTPKFEEAEDGEGTDYRNVANSIGYTAAILDIGRYGKYNINPLQVLYTSNPDKYTFSDHVELLLQFFNVLFKNPESSPHENKIATTLKELYASRGIIREDPKTWENAAWPTLPDLHKYWEYLLEKNPKDPTLQALINKTAMCDDQWDFLNRPTTIDLTKDFLIFDLSGCPPSIKEAMNVFVVGLLGQLFGKPGAHRGRGTIIAVDEASVFLESVELANFVLQILRMGRSAGLTGWFGTQSVRDFELNPKAAAQFSANIFQNYILGRNMRKDNIPIVKNYFKLSDSEVKHLLNCKAGEGVAKIGNEFVPLRIKLSDYELDVIKGKKTGQTSPETSIGTSPDPMLSLPELGFRVIDNRLTDLIKSNGIVFQSWTPENNLQMEKLGYGSIHQNRVIGMGRPKIYIRNGLLINGMIENQTLEHYAAVIEIAGYLIMNGCMVKINHSSDVDISAVINGKKIAFEYERPSTKSNEELIRKFQAAKTDHDEVYFICTASNEERLTEVFGGSNVIPRGFQLEEFLKNLLSINISDSNVIIE